MDAMINCRGDQDVEVGVGRRGSRCGCKKARKKGKKKVSSAESGEREVWWESSSCGGRSSPGANYE